MRGRFVQREARGEQPGDRNEPEAVSAEAGCCHAPGGFVDAPQNGQHVRRGVDVAGPGAFEIQVPVLWEAGLEVGKRAVQDPFGGPRIEHAMVKKTLRSPLMSLISFSSALRPTARR